MPVINRLNPLRLVAIRSRKWPKLYIAIAVVLTLVAAPTGVYALYTVLRSIGGNAFSVSSCVQSTVNSVQSGTAILPGNGTVTTSISTVDPTKTFLQFSTASTGNVPGGSTVRGRIASGTQLEFVRVSGETSPAAISVRYYVVEYLCGVTVQRGSAIQTTATTNVSINPVPATDRAFLTWSETGSPAETDWASGHQTVGELTSVSSLQFRTRATPVGGMSGWYAGWSYRKALTIDGTKVTANHTDFPVLVSLAADAGLTASAQADGGDIVFTSADGTTKLSHQIESFHRTSGTLVAWVKVPSLPTATNTTLYMYYGNASARGQQNPSGVWDANYQSVWHMNQPPNEPYANDIKDSIAAPNHGSSHGSMGATENPVSGKIGNALSFDGMDDYLSTATSTAGPQAFTLEAWLHTTSASGHKIIGLEDTQTGQTSTNFGSMLYTGTDGNVRFGLYDTAQRSVPGSAVADGQWHHVAATFDTAVDRAYLYVDGTQHADVVVTQAQSFTGWWRIGGYKATGWTGGADGYLPGRLDEVRVSTTARSPGWVSTAYNNQSAPSTFYAIGAEESAPVAASPHTIWWQVISFNASSEIKVQRGTTSLAAGALSTDVTLPVAVDQAHAFSLVSFASSGAGPDMGARALHAQLTNSTTLTIQRSDPGSPDPVEDIAWQVVDLLDGSQVRYGSATFADGASTATASFASVDTTRATAFASVDYGGGAAMGRTTYIADDVPGAATATVTLASATQVDLVRANTGGITNIAWYVVEWGGPVVPVVAASGGALPYTENTTVAVDPGITVTDDGANLTSATVTLTTNYVNGQDALAFTNANGITGTWTPATGVLALSGSATVANYQAALRSITYSNTSDNPSTATRTVTFAVNDGTFASNTASRSITIIAVNDAPLNSVPGSQATSTNTAKVFSTGNGNLISISDADAESAPVQVQLTGTNGTVTVSGTSGLTFSVGDGTADATMTFTGTTASINAALAGLSFTPTASFNGTATLQIVTNDQGNSPSGALSDTDSVSITVAPAANIAFHGSAAIGSAGVVTSLAVAKPAAVVDGDVMITTITTRNTAITQLSGWTLIDSSVHASGTLRTSWYWKVASAEPSSWTWAMESSKASITVIAFSGVDTTSPFRSQSYTNTLGTSADRNIYAPSQDPVIDGTYVVYSASIAYGTVFTAAPAGFSAIDATSYAKSTGNSGATQTATAVSYKSMGAQPSSTGSLFAVAVDGTANTGWSATLRPVGA